MTLFCLKNHATKESFEFVLCLCLDSDNGALVFKEVLIAQNLFCVIAA